MISWTELLTQESAAPDNLRYSKVCLDPIPKIVVWNVTSCCNLRCRHCYFDASRHKDANELTHQEARDFIVDLSDWGVSVLLFSGGEPLLRQDIFELGKFAGDRGIRPVISTNGTLITEEVAKRIKESGFWYVGISIDGMERINDWFRRQRGTFKKAQEGIRNCQRSGLKVGLRLTLTKYNFKDLPAIFDIVERESIPRVCLYHLVYTGRGNNLKEKDLSHKEKRQVLEFIWQKTLDFSQKGLKIEILTVDNHADGPWIYLKLKKHHPQTAQVVLELLRVQGGNSSGIGIIAVDNHGNIYPDQFWRSHPLGNIRQRQFSDIWQDKDNRFLQALRERRLYLKGKCQRCNYLEICNGNFRARAEAAFGDPWAEDPACYLTEKEISET